MQLSKVKVSKQMIFVALILIISFIFHEETETAICCLSGCIWETGRQEEPLNTLIWARPMKQVQHNYGILLLSGFTYDKLVKLSVG